MVQYCISKLPWNEGDRQCLKRNVHHVPRIYYPYTGLNESVRKQWMDSIFGCSVYSGGLHSVLSCRKERKTINSNAQKDSIFRVFLIY